MEFSTFAAFGLLGGLQAKVIRKLSEKELSWAGNVPHIYQQLAIRSLQTMKLVEAYKSLESDRKSLDISGHVSKPLHEARKD